MLKTFNVHKNREKKFANKVENTSADVHIDRIDKFLTKI